MRQYDSFDMWIVAFSVKDLLAEFQQLLLGLNVDLVCQLEARLNVSKQLVNVLPGDLCRHMWAPEATATAAKIERHFMMSGTIVQTSKSIGRL